MTESAQNADSRRKPQIFADSPESPGNSSFWRAQIFAENRRFSQKTAGNRRLGSAILGASRSCVALRGFSLRGFGDAWGFPFCGGKKVWDSLLGWGKGCETPSFPRSEHEERGSLRPFAPSQEVVSDPFSHRARGNLVVGSYIPKSTKRKSP